MPEFDDIPGELLHNAGQASRLRRRGAIRSVGSRTDLFISSAPQQQHHSFGRESADAVLVGALRAATAQRGTRWVICGGPNEEATDGEEDEWMEAGHEPYWPSPLPMDIDLSPKSRPRGFGRAPSRATRPIENGCGAVLHYSALSVPRVSSCAARIDPDDEDAAVGPLPESSHPVPRPASTCGCVRERVGCLRCGNEVGVRYRPCERHAARVVRASVLFDPARTHPDESFAETTAPADGDGEDSDSDAGSSTGLHTTLSALGSFLNRNPRQPLRSPPPVPTPLRANMSPMLALADLPRLLGEPSWLPATGANATPLSPVSMSAALLRSLRDDLDSPSTPVDGDMADSDAGRSTPMPARRVRRKRSESIER
ncbi:hypothetical protein RhiJN_04451 [Ceratobasidium sp. AG-Ba]|nr:hypothetical protein RhiJN_04451 [Ceratobasidium sp. AG-Ba]QRW05341.1 hypothetical protein RhiLY_04340 [Ceratobasidium sp. AG-Ba]